GNNLTASAPAPIASTISEGVKHPGAETRPNRFVTSITFGLRLGETMKLAPASAARSTSSGRNTVPAPTAMREPKVVARRPIESNAPGELSVASTAVIPDSTSASTISSSRPPKSPRRMATMRPASLRSITCSDLISTSPICDCPVRPPKDFDRLVTRREFSGQSQFRRIERNAQSRAVIRPQLTVFVIEMLRQIRDVELIRSRQLHQHRARKSGADVNQRGLRNRAGEMRRQPDVMRLAHCGLFNVLGDATAVRNASAVVIDQMLLDHFVEFPPRPKLLADRDRNFYLFAKLAVYAGVFRTNQVFAEIRLERFEQCAQPHGVREIQPRVVINTPI